MSRCIKNTPIKCDLSHQQQKVLNTLSSQDKPMTAYDLLDTLRDDGVRSPPIVYRALEKLQSLGLVHRVESLGAYVACQCQCASHSDNRQAQKDWSPFAICTGCGDVRELDDPSLTKALKKISAGFLAVVDHKVFEISGLCQKCQKGNKTHV